MALAMTKFRRKLQLLIINMLKEHANSTHYEQQTGFRLELPPSSTSRDEEK